MWIKIFAWAKKIHNYVMWGVIALGAWMMLSGYIMHRESEGSWLPTGLDTLFLRHWHNTLSTWFILILGLQMLTGFTLWLAPRMIRRARPVQPEETA